MINESLKMLDVRLILGIFLSLLVPMAGITMTDAPSIWPLSTLLYNLGLLFCFVLAPRRLTRIIVYNMVAAGFFLVEIAFFISYYLQNTGFNEAFFYHLRPDLIHAGVQEHLPILLSSLACLAGFLIMASSVVARYNPMKRRLAPVALSLLLLGLFISPPARALVEYVENIPQIPKGNRLLFEDYAELLGPKVTVEFLGKDRPNIVLIYAESLEQAYFDETVFPGLLPNLKRLRQQSTDFTNVAQGVGAEWTVGGIVASQCGYPLTASHDVSGNEFSLFDDFLPRATCLVDLLKGDGYHTTFIGGADPRFGGKDDFLRSHGYSEVLGRDELLKSLTDPSYSNDWGVFDDTLFEFALAKFNALSGAKAPFLLTLLTIDTHHPEGFLSRSCGTYGTGDNSSLDAVHCSDLLISQFVEQIRQSPFSENTIIIVLSDHLAMRNQATPLLETSTVPGRLTFFVNYADNETKTISSPGVHFDVAPTILDLIGYQVGGQMGFGAPLTLGDGYLPGKFGEEAWRKQVPDLMAIGSTLWNDELSLDQNGIKFSAKDLSLKMGGREFNLNAFEGYTKALTPSLFIINEKTLKIEKIKTYPFDQTLAPFVMGNDMLQYKENLVLALSNAGNLAGFSDPRINPDRWAFFFGRPGGGQFTWGPISGSFFFPYEMIRDLSQSEMNERIVLKRQELLQTIEKGYNARKE